MAYGLGVCDYGVCVSVRVLGHELGLGVWVWGRVWVRVWVMVWVRA